MLEHFFDNDIKAGDVYESKFIKGGIRIWMSKDAPFKNRVMRISIRFKRDLTLNKELRPPEGVLYGDISSHFK